MLGSGPEGSAYNAVSANGEAVFFTAQECAGGPIVNELYMRASGEHTVAISEPALPGDAAGECASNEPCHDAQAKGGLFQGASENGQHVFFLSEQPLVNGAAAVGMKLYEERLEGASVAEVIDISNLGAGAGLDPEVQGVVRVSENGERVYFVAKGKLTGSDMVAGREPEKSEPEEGADNLYVYEPDLTNPKRYRIQFISTLLAPGEEAAVKVEEVEEAGEVQEVAQTVAKAAFEEALSHEVPFGEAIEIYEEVEAHQKEVLSGTLGPSGSLAVDSSVWQVADRRPAQATPDGGFLVFLSSAELTAGDSSRVPQLFEYDASRESLVRASVGNGGVSSGNIGTFSNSPRIPEQTFNGVDPPTASDTGLAISDDGSSVFFDSAASLVPQAERGATNVYEYRLGGVYLVSSGNDTSSYENKPTAALVGIDSSGQNAFFLTANQLVPEYGETQMALYDAREEGGFPATKFQRGCAGETCRGSLGATLQSPIVGSTNQAGGGNQLAPTSKAVVGRSHALTRAQKLAKALRACHARRRKRRRVACEAQARDRYGVAVRLRRESATRSHLPPAR